MSEVKLKNIKKIYDKKVVAVQEFCLDIEDKEFIVLVGPSGCGKSTTLRMIAGLEEISEGELYIGDKLVNDIEPKDRDIAMVFQNYALYPHMSVYDNMAFGLKLRREKKLVIQKKVYDAAKTLGITELLDRKPKALSGGQRQRVAIGRAIVRNPKLFLMDEPLSNLDAKLRNQMRAEIIKLHKNIDTTFIYVTHDQTEAMTLGDRIVIMKDGFIQQIGTPQQVFNHPKNLFVAGFIGAPRMNFFNAKLKRNDDKYSVILEGRTIPLPINTQKKLLRNGQLSADIILGARPEHIVISKADCTAAVKAKVDVSELMGSEIYLHVDVNGTEAVLRIPTTELPDHQRIGLEQDSIIEFTLLTEFVHLFDVESEVNLLL